MQEDIRVLGEYVLVKQTMVAKKSAIILQRAKQDADKFDFYFEVLQKGSDCKRDINVGECPVFADHVRFQGLKVLEKDEKKMVAMVIVHEGDIIGVDNSRLFPKEEEITDHELHPVIKIN